MRDFFASRRKETKYKNVDGEPPVDRLHFAVDSSQIVATEIETEIRLPVAPVNRVVNQLLIIRAEDAHSRRSKDVERDASSETHEPVVPIGRMQQPLGSSDHSVERFPDSVQVVDVGAVNEKRPKKGLDSGLTLIRVDFSHLRNFAVAIALQVKQVEAASGATLRKTMERKHST